MPVMPLCLLGKLRSFSFLRGKKPSYNAEGETAKETIKFTAGEINWT